MDTLTGSKLPRAEICAASFALPAVLGGTSRYAEAGNVVHAQLEGLAHGRTDGVPAWLVALYLDITEGAHAVYAERCLAWDPVTGEGRDLGTHDRDYSGLRKGEIPCTVDLLVLRGVDDSIVYDYKSGYLGARVDTPQLTHQALAAVGAFGLDGIHASIVHLDVEAETAKTKGRYLDAFDLESEADRVRGIVRRVAKARALPLAQLDVRESDHGCRYCPCWASCPAKTKAIATLAAHAGLARPGVEIVVTPETAGLVWAGIEAMESVLATAKAKVKELARMGPVALPDGSELWAVETSREAIADVDAIERLVLERYGAEAAASVVTVQKSTTKGAIEAVAKKHAAPKQGAKEARSLLDAARVAGAIKSSSYLSYTPKEKVGLSMEAITVTGNLGKDAELKRTQKGDAFATFSVACQKKKDSPTTWYRVAFFGARGEGIARYLTKGTKVTVIGEFEVREYEKDGLTKTSLEIRAYDVSLQGGGERSEGASSSYTPRDRNDLASPRSKPTPQGDGGDGGYDGDDSIPFLAPSS